MRRRFALVLLLTFAGLVFGGAQDLRRDELRCEEAVQRLADCCSSRFYPGGIDCSYIPPGCDSSAKEPEISELQAGQILGESCDAVAQERLCGR